MNLFRSSKRSSSAASGRYDPNAYAAVDTQYSEARRASNASLSAAAAAAALRSTATTPTPGVGEIQTKRMIRRGSTASNASNASNVRPTGGMQRRISSGSMTERTFRSPSPGPGNRSRPSSAAGWTPPVPAMPKIIPDVKPRKLQKRNTSQESVARVLSPEPAPNTRSTSVERNVNPPAVSRRGSVRASSLSRVPEGQERGEGPINFSRPMSPEGRPASRQMMGREVLARIPEPMDPESDGGTPGRATSTNRLSIQAQVKIAARERQQALARGAPPPAPKPMTPAALAALSPGRPASAAGQRPPSRPVSVQGQRNIPPRPASATGERMVWVPTRSASAQGQNYTPSRPGSAQGQSYTPARPASAQGRPITQAGHAVTRSNTLSTSVRDRTSSSGRPMSSMGMRSVSNTIPEEGPAIMVAGLPERIPQPTYTSRPVTNTGRQRPRSGTAPSGPSQEQIKSFQDKATMHLARPREPVAASPASVSQPNNDDTQRSRATSSAGAAALVAAGATTRPRAASQTLAAPRGGRGPSASPARSARFAEQTLPGVRHQPPPRSVSPSKPSLRGYSPAESYGVPTNASSVSLISEDGTRRKKAVGFSEVPTVLGETKKPVSFITNNGAPSFPQDHDGSMGSRPALPSFDSVRSRKEAGFNTAIDGSYQTRNTSSASSSMPYGAISSSNEPVIAAISRMNATATPYQAAPNAISDIPQPSNEVDEFDAMLNRIDASTQENEVPNASSEVTTHGIGIAETADVAKQPEMNGYDDAVTSPENVLARIFGGSQHASPQSQQHPNVPAISVLPASPSLEQGDGTFSRDFIDSHAITTHEGAFHPGENTHVDTDASSFYDESPRPAYNQEIPEQDEQRVAEHSTKVEEPAGYASLNGIVENPTTEGARQKLDSGSVPPAGLAGVVSPLGSKSPEEDWAKIKAYWSGLSEQRKQQIESGVAPPEESTVPQRNMANSGQVLRQTQNNAQPRTVSGGQYAIGGPPSQAQYNQGPNIQARPSPGPSAQNSYSNDQAVQQKPPVKTPIKSAMKPGTNRVDGPINPNPIPLPPWPDEEYQQSARSRGSSLRSSLRPEQARNNSDNGSQRRGMRSSMRGMEDGVEHVRPSGSQRMTAQRAAGGLAASRAAEAQGSRENQAPPPSEAAIALARQQMQKLALQKAKSNDSDSDSSFKRNKKRRDKANEGGRYSMARSMRDNAPADARPMLPAGAKTSRFGMRSPSPSGSPNKKSLLGFRSGSIDSGVPKESKGFAGFGRKSKPQVEQPVAAAPFQSRFNDSDDEDVGRPTPFTGSRLVDSDDEGSPAQSKLAPVRGIPRKSGHQASQSTDLSDEGLEGRALQAGTLRGDGAVFESPPGNKKGIRGMFHLGKKHHGSTNHTTTNGVTTEKEPGSPGAKPNGILRRLSLSQSQSPSGAPVTPKKHQVTGPGTANEWPYLPPPVPETYGNEYPSNSPPNTSDGTPIAGNAARQALGSSNDDVKAGADRPQRPTIVSRKSGKKKRFQGLRRALGMHD